MPLMRSHRKSLSTFLRLAVVSLLIPPPLVFTPLFHSERHSVVCAQSKSSTDNILRKHSAQRNVSGFRYRSRRRRRRIARVMPRATRAVHHAPAHHPAKTHYSVAELAQEWIR